MLDKLNRLRNIIIPILKVIPNTPYSQYSEGHAKRVLSLIVLLFYPSLKTHLNAKELFIMAFLCLVHDIGMKPREDCQYDSQLYKDHWRYSGEYVKSLRTNNDLQLDKYTIDAVAELSLVHNLSINEAKFRLDFLAIEDCRSTLIYSMFKIADMLEFNLQPGEILRMSPNVITETIAEHDIDNKQQIITLIPAAKSNSECFNKWVKELKKRFQQAHEEFDKVGINYTIKIE